MPTKKIKSGDKAPDFVLPDPDGKAFRLSEFRGKTVVLYFYPKDMTPGCTAEACDFRDFHSDFIKLNAAVFGVSPDTGLSHQKFIQKHNLPFTLLCDVDHKVAKQYGAWGKKTLYGKEYTGVLRTTFIISPDGIVRHVFTNVKVKGHVESILSLLKQ